MEQSKEQKKKRNKLDSQWLDRILDECEKVGVSIKIIERFEHYYVAGREDINAKSSSTTARPKSTLNWAVDYRSTDWWKLNWYAKAVLSTTAWFRIWWLKVSSINFIPPVNDLKYSLMGGMVMSRKPIVKVTFNEDLQSESYYFLKRLIEKILIEQIGLDMNPRLKGQLLMESKDIIEKE
jgi:hypothetical protein